MTWVSRSLRVAAVGTAVALAVAVGGCASTKHAAAPAGKHTASVAGTVTKTFLPYAATGTLVVPVADHLTGDCWTGSIAVPKLGVYRCLVGNAIYDPCFAPARESAPPTVACVPDPWSSAHVVTLRSALPDSTPARTTTAPWALELANGAHCIAGTGTVAVVAGVPMSYLCGTGLGAGQLTGPPAAMTVEYGSATGSAVAVVPVTTAWRA
jgi:hypothetical protein